MDDWTLVLGSKNYSSWSLRAWLVLTHAGARFEEVVVPLDQPDSREALERASPTGRVPVLRAGDLTIWDSLAIAEYVAERFPEAGLWPADAGERALARSVSAEMHSGFAALRQSMPFNVRRSSPGVGRSDEVDREIARVLEIWRICRERAPANGPCLFGRFSIADAMFAPVVSRFTTYVVEVDAVGRAYMDAIWALDSMRAWRAAAVADPHVSPSYDR